MSLPSLNKAVADILGRNSLNLSDLRVSVSGKGVIVRHIDMPRMGLEELRLCVKYEAKLLLPFSLDDCVFDCHILGSGANDKVKMRVLLAAARRAIVQERLELLKSVGVTPKVVSIGAIALANAFEATVKRHGPDETVSIVNVGATRSTLDIISGTNLEFTRDIEVGGDKATVAIARGLSVDFSEAERRKQAADAGVKEFVAPMVMALSNELNSTFDYVSSKMNKKVRKIYLSGGIALCQDLRDTLASEFDIEVALWNPVEAMLAEGHGPPGQLPGREPMLAVATGLAVVE